MREKGRERERERESLSKSFYYTKCFTDLGKLNLLMVVQFKSQFILTPVPFATKNNARFKRGKIDSKIIKLLC